jgi:hypothetical protein
MTHLRRSAVFQLIVAGLAALAVAGMLAATGRVLPSLAGFAVLGLLGLRPAILIGRRATSVQDERDGAIARRAIVAAHVVLWLALVSWGVAIPLLFGHRGSVPLTWVAPVVPAAMWLVTCVQSVTTLVLDSRGA